MPDPAERRARVSLVGPAGGASAAAAGRPKPTITVLVPALDEEAHIEDAVSEVRIALGDRFSAHEIILFDDGSTDRTGAIMDELVAADPEHVRVVHNPTSKNLGGVYKQGIALARHDYLLFVPGDNENPSPSLIPALDAVGDADIVIPYVVTDVRSPFRALASGAYNRLCNAVFGTRLRYFNGTVIHRVDNLRSITIETDSFAYQSEALVKLLRAGKTFVQVGVDLPPRQDARSSALRLKNLAGVGWALVRLTARVRLGI